MPSETRSAVRAGVLALLIVVSTGFAGVSTGATNTAAPSEPTPQVQPAGSSESPTDALASSATYEPDNNTTTPIANETTTATTPTTTPTEPDSTPTNDTTPSTETEGSAEIGTQLRTAATNGETVQAIVRMDGKLGDTVTTKASVSTMKDEARERQAAVVEYARATDGINVLNRLWLANAVLVEVDTTTVSIDQLASIQGVDRVHANFEVQSPEPVNRTNVSTEPGTLNATSVAAAETSNVSSPNTTYGVDMVDAPEVWNQFRTRGGGIKVAVLDTGVHAEHPDIELFTRDASDPTYPGGWAEFNATGGIVPGSRPHDESYHGTHVSGTITGGNASGEYIGVAPNASLMVGQVLNQDNGSTGTFAQIVAGMQWAVQGDAEILSMSLGASGYFPLFVEPVQNAESAGTLVVASSGNDGYGVTGSPGNVYPALSVGAVDNNASVAEFSSGDVVDTSAAFGDAAPASWPDEYIVPDVTAPGVAVKSAFPGGNYYELQGTSMAAPHVSGVAALLLSATNDTVAPALVKEALVQSTWKPDGQQSAQDTRYGHGIVDADEAAVRLAADNGITGAVSESENGYLLPGARVTIEDVRTTRAGSAGSYTVRARPGTYNVTANAVGFKPESAEVTVTDGEFSVQHFVLEDTAAFRNIDPAPSAVEQGEELSVTYTGWNPHNITVQRAGNYTGNVSLYIEEEDRYGRTELEFNESYNLTSYQDPSNFTLIAVPESGDGGNLATNAGDGTLILESTVQDEDGDATTVQTDSTTVYPDRIDIGVVSDPTIDWTVANDPYTAAVGPELVTRLENVLPGTYDVTLFNSTAAATNHTSDYDAFVVNHVSDTTSDLETFIEQTRGANTGVVYLEESSGWANAVTKIAETTGHPRNLAGDGHTGNALFYNYTDPSHPIAESVVDNGSTQTKIRVPNHMSWSDGYDGSGEVADIGREQCDPWYGCEVIWTDELRNYENASGMVTDDLNRKVVAHGLGQSLLTASSPAIDAGFREGGNETLASAVEWAANGSRSDVSLTAGQPEKVTPNSTFDLPLRGSVNSVNLTIDERYTTVDKSNVNATVVEMTRGGEVVHDLTFGESLTLNTRAALVVRVHVSENATGTLSLDHTYNGAVPARTVTGSTGQTSVYGGDTLRVTPDGNLQHALNTVVPGDEVVLENGTYPIRNQESYSVRFDKQNVTIRGAAGSQPVIRDCSNCSGGLSGDPVLDVNADDVTVSGVTLKDSDGYGVFAQAPGGKEGLENLTVRDATVIGGISAFNLDNANALFEGVQIENVTVRNSSTGIEAYKAHNVTITNSTFATDRFGISITGTNITVANNTLEYDSQSDSQRPRSTGIQISYGTVIGLDHHYGNKIVNNTIRGWGTGATLRDGVGVDFRNNHVTETTTGVTSTIEPAGFTATHRLVGNDFDGDVGFHLANTGAKYVTVQGNDFADATIGIRNELPNHMDSPATQLDARLNYFGPTGPNTNAAEDGTGDAPGVVGPVIAEPFLPAPSTPTPAENASQTPFATSVELDAGGKYAIGVPGPVSGTVDEVFSDFDGVIYGFNATTSSWTQLTANDTVQPLSAMLVIPETDSELVVSFHADTDSPTAPTQTNLTDGWNFVSAPTYNTVEHAFGVSSGDISMVMQPYAGPSAQPGPASTVDGSYMLGSTDAAPTASAFTGYFVFAESTGKLPARVTTNPTLAEYYNKLGLDTPATSRPTTQLNSTVRSRVNRAIRMAGMAAPADNRSAAQAALREELASTLKHTTTGRIHVIDEIETTVVAALLSENFESETAVRSAVVDAVEDAVTAEPTTPTNSTTAAAATPAA